MKQLAFGLLTMATFSIAIKNAAAQSKNEVAVKSLITTYFNALNSSDTKKVVSLFTYNGVLLATGAPTATGSEQLKGTFQYVFDNFTYTLQVSIGEVIIKENYAFVRSTSKGSYITKASGQKTEDDFREVFVLQKVGEEWKIATYMYNKAK